ncbi:GPI biosynthesis protein family Pig-F-domain-containing protein [Lipomyces chichibuensis]|uniref:GPI biosynthesis protein family Pig-F-domain-containing protein n=1 Tax=Lipomyces chichibuensis TaxID=1546026 RepID=UPI0033440BE5
MARIKSTPRQISTPSAPTSPIAVPHKPNTHYAEDVFTSSALLAFPIVTVVLSSLLPSDPVKILAYSLPLVALIQAVNILFTSPAPEQVSKSSGNKKKKQAKSTVSTTILGLVLSILLTPFIHLIYILFGAPVTVSIPATFLLSAHTALLALFPILCTFPLDGVTWINIVALKAPLTPAYTAALGTIAGAWLGAVPIPLDWDREWQTWPVTVVFGAYVGNAVGRLVGAVLSGKEKKL